MTLRRMPEPGPIERWLTPRWTFAVCAALLMVFATLSYSAAWTKGATWDEPEHLLGAYIHRHHLDFRINPEDPALFGWIASIPLRAGAIRVDVNEPLFHQIADDTAWQWPFIWRTLYRTGGNDPDPLLRRARAMSTLVGVALGAVIAWWAFALGGAVAAVIATALYTFCPNFLGHASLVKNDVMLSAALLALMFSVWRFGRRGTWWNLSAIALLTGAAVSVKYSGVLAAGFVVVALVARALLPEPWTILWMSLTTRLRRLSAAAGAIAVVAVISYVSIWAVYGFRYAPAPDPQVSLNMARVEAQAKMNHILAERVRERMRFTGENVQWSFEIDAPTPQDLADHPPSTVLRGVTWMNEHRLLPQAWLYGFLYTYKSTLIRSTYLLGEYRITGWWYFFPLAMLFKTPLATLVAAMLALCVAVVSRFDRPSTRLPRLDRWAAICLAAAPVLYGASALSTNLNLGLRHVLPIYPFIFVATGIVLARIVQGWAWPGRIIVAVLVCGLTIEAVAAFPNYIAFFNVPAGGSRGGIKLLADSNLDWGQDLKLLARWQQENPDKKLYLSYFGIEDPEYRRIKATHLPGGYIFAQYTSNPPQIPSEPGVLAVSATNLLGVYYGPDERQAYGQLMAHEPLEVLGGSIYLYPFPLVSPAATAQQN